MLHRSFKPAKCKTSLKLATSRLKLMKNKKEGQVKQLKRELAQLLEAGQDQTARIRVEHVVREEKTMAAYDLLEIFCELIAARLPIIESQKNCPIDLKEAITSVVFASPRCADIPELQDVRKSLTAKYGKEFISAAVELRPECGVSRLLVEKLSANAPDGPTKIKILSAIAEEHNIKWEPKSFGEKELRPPDDLLNGPSTFEQASRMQAEPPIVQPPPSKAQAPPSPEQKHNAPVNFERNTRSSTSSENFASTDPAAGAQATMPAPYHPGGRPSGNRSERMEDRHSYSGDGNSFSSDRKNWNMEFKDATAAAQAAAESAERASMAARAAAELSSRANITRQNSSESQKSNNFSSRDERPTKYAASKLSTEQFANDSGHNFFQDRNPPKQTQQVDRNEHNNSDEATERFYKGSHGSNQRSSESASLRSNTSSIDNQKPMNDFQKGDRYSQQSPFEEETVKEEMSVGFSQMNMKKQSIGSEVEFASSLQGGLQFDDFNYFAEERIRKQTSSVSSHSHSSNRGDDCGVSLSSHREFEIDGGDNPFVGIDRRNEHSDTGHSSSYDNPGVVFDEPVSDDDIIRFDAPKYDDMQESNLYSISPGRESPSHNSLNTDTWSPRQNRSGSFEKFSSVSHVSAEWHSPPKFDERSTKPAQRDEFLPVAFDDSESPSSESEDELDKRLMQCESHGSSGSFHTQKIDSGSHRKQDLTYSSDDDKDGTEFSAESRGKFGFYEVPNHQSSAKLAKSQMFSNEMASEPLYDQVEERKSRVSPQTSRLSFGNEAKGSSNTYIPDSSDTTKDDEWFEQSSLESELNFGTLTGGLRNKGYIRPPYTKSPSADASSSSKKAAEDSMTTIEHSLVVKSSFKSEMSTKVENKSSLRTPIRDYDSDTDDSEEEIPQGNSRNKREPTSPKAIKEVDTRSRLRAPATLFASVDNESEEDLPKRASTGTGRVGSGLSRRTKPTPSYGTSSYSKATLGSDASVDSDTDSQKIPSRTSYRSETPPNPRFQTASSDNWGSPAEPRAAKQSTLKPMAESTMHKEDLKSSAFERPSLRQENLSSSAKQATSKPTQESNISTRQENLKSSAFEPPPNRQENRKSSAFEPPPNRQENRKSSPFEPTSSRQENRKSSPFDPPSNRQETVKSSTKQGTSKPIQESNISTRKNNLRSSAFEQPSSPLKTVSSATTESPMASTSSGEPPSRESSLKKASHVHPKLPDYDAIAALLESHRSNR